MEQQQSCHVVLNRTTTRIAFSAKGAGSATTTMVERPKQPEINPNSLKSTGPASYHSKAPPLLHSSDLTMPSLHGFNVKFRLAFDFRLTFSFKVCLFPSLCMWFHRWNDSLLACPSDHCQVVWLVLLPFVVAAFPLKFINMIALLEFVRW